MHGCMRLEPVLQELLHDLGKEHSIQSKGITNLNLGSTVSLAIKRALAQQKLSGASLSGSDQVGSGSVGSASRTGFKCQKIEKSSEHLAETPRASLPQCGQTTGACCLSPFFFRCSLLNKAHAMRNLELWSTYWWLVSAGKHMI